jgi:hypothetical protein
MNKFIKVLITEDCILKLKEYQIEKQYIKAKEYILS